MEHSKKMMLVDPNDLRSVKKHHSLLDRDISNVLNLQSASDSEKARLYQQTLARFLINRQAIEADFKEPINVRETPKEKSVEETFISGLPFEQRAKATQVLEDLFAYTPLRWDEKGQLKSDGQVISGSDLPSLISHELQQGEKKTTPIGWDVFTSSLHPNIKIPKLEKKKTKSKVSLPVLTESRKTRSKGRNVNKKWENY